MEPDPNEKIVAFAPSAKKSLMYISEAYREDMEVLLALEEADHFLLM